MVMTNLVSGRHAVPVDERAELEVPERATRRVFSAQYKLRILAEYERRDRDDRSALLRREGLYTSSISEWRRQREEGALQALGGTGGGEKPGGSSTSSETSQRCWSSSPRAARSRTAASRSDGRSDHCRTGTHPWEASGLQGTGAFT